MIKLISYLLVNDKTIKLSLLLHCYTVKLFKLLNCSNSITLLELIELFKLLTCDSRNLVNY